jgi:hypothetical protein
MSSKEESGQPQKRPDKSAILPSVDETIRRAMNVKRPADGWPWEHPKSKRAKSEKRK